MTMIQATFLHNYNWWQEKGFFLCDSFASVNRLIWLRRKPYRIGTKLLLNSWIFFFSFKCSEIVHFLLGVCEASNQNLYYIVIELRWQRLHWKIQCSDFASVFSKLDQTSLYCTKSFAVHPGSFEILAIQRTDFPGWHHERPIRASNVLFIFVYLFWMTFSKIRFTLFVFVNSRVSASSKFFNREFLHTRCRDVVIILCNIFKLR